MISNVLNAFMVVLIGVGVSTARANYVGNDTSNFNPIPSGLDFVTVHSSRTLAPGYINIGLYFNQATNSLPDTRDGSGNLIGADDRMIFGDLGMAFGITEKFEAAASMSYLVEQDVDRTQPGAQFAGTGLNEIKFLGKYSFLKKSPWGLALVASVNVNQTENNPFVGEGGGPSTNIEGVVDYHAGSSSTALNVGYRFRHKGTKLPKSVYDPIGDQVIASLATSYYFDSVDTKIIAEIWAAQLTESNSYDSSGDVSSEALLGFKYDATADLSLQAGYGTRVSDGLFTPDWRVYVGLALSYDVLKKPSAEDIVAPAPTPLAAAPSSPETPKDSVEVIRLENLDFAFGSSEIQPRHFPLLNSVVEYLSSKPNIKKISIEGHTDSVGSAERNRKRSQERAENVKKYLQKSAGLKDLNIEAIGYGADRPISDNGNAQGRALNRRVEVRITRTDAGN